MWSEFLKKNLKKNIKRAFALLIVASLVFSANVLEAVKLVYANVVESSGSLDDNVKEEVEESSIIINEEEKEGSEILVEDLPKDIKGKEKIDIEEEEDITDVESEFNFDDANKNEEAITDDIEEKEEKEKIMVGIIDDKNEEAIIDDTEEKEGKEEEEKITVGIIDDKSEEAIIDDTEEKEEIADDIIDDKSEEAIADDTEEKEEKEKITVGIIDDKSEDVIIDDTEEIADDIIDDKSEEAIADDTEDKEDIESDDISDDEKEKEEIADDIIDDKKEANFITLDDAGEKEEIVNDIIGDKKEEDKNAYVKPLLSSGDSYAVSWDLNGGSWASSAPSVVFTSNTEYYSSQSSVILASGTIPSADKVNAPSGKKLKEWQLSGEIRLMQEDPERSLVAIVYQCTFNDTIAPGTTSYNKDFPCDSFYEHCGDSNAAFESCTLKAIYEDVPAIKITMDGGVGNSPSDIYAKIGKYYTDSSCSSEVTTKGNPGLQTAYAGQYTFAGWYDDRNTDYSPKGNKRFGADGAKVGDSTWVTEETTLYACWNKVVYTITLNDNGGTGGSGSIYLWYKKGKYSDSGATTTLSSVTKPTRSGYAFDGYSKDSTKYINANGAYNANFTNEIFTGATVLKADWIPNKYHISINQDSGVGGTNDLWVIYDTGIYSDSTYATEVTGPIAVPTKANYLFAGYYDEGLSTQYVDGSGAITSSFTTTTWDGDPDTTINMKAKWVPVYKITLNSNGGTGLAPTEIYITEGTTIITAGVYEEATCATAYTTATLTKPTKIQNAFKGFNSEANGTGTDYIDEDGNVLVAFTASTFTADTEIFAKWAPAIYEITFNNDGATSLGTEKLWVKYGEGIYIDSGCINIYVDPISIPAKTGYKYKGYCDDPTLASPIIYVNEDGTLASAFNNTAFTSNTEIKAKWENNIYTIDLDNNGASTTGTTNLFVKYNDGIYDTLVCSGTSLTAIPTKPTKAPYIFDGYYSDTTWTTQYIDKNGNFNTTNFTSTVWDSDDTTTHITMIAKWSPVYEITLDVNNTDVGSTGVMPTTVWLKEGDGIWTTENCTTEFTELTTLPTRPYFGFKGFVENEDGTGEIYINDDGTKNAAFDSVSWTSNKTIYALWGPAIYRITLDNDGADVGSEGTREVYEKYDDNIYAEEDCLTIVGSITPPTKANYIFEGYFDKETLTTQYINADGTINTTNFTNTAFTSANRIKAKWTPKIYEITLNDDGADTTGTTVIYEKYGVGFYSDPECTEVLTRITKPAKGDTVCKGYYESAGGAGTKYIKEDGTIDTGVLTNTTITSNGTVYYAAYTDVIYEITLDKTNGSGGVSILYKQEEGSIYTDKKCINLATKISYPSKSQYIFAGYYEGNKGEGTMYVDNNGYVVMGAFTNSAITLYANWVSKYSGGGSGGGGGGGGGGSTIPIMNKDGIVIKPSPYYQSDMVIYWDNNVLQIDYTIIKDKNTNRYKYTVDGTPVLNKWVGEAGLNNKVNWRYININNEESKGWQAINSVWYYFDDNGIMYTGSHVIDGQTYYFNEAQNQEEGKLINDNAFEKGNMYIVASTGDRYKKNINDNKYYYTNGELVVNKWIYENDSSGKNVCRYVDSCGELWKGWLVVNDDWYFFDNDGIMLTGYQVINDIPLYFIEDGSENEGKLYKGVITLDAN